LNIFIYGGFGAGKNGLTQKYKGFLMQRRQGIGVVSG
jgi:hypothetical protein